MRFINYLNLHRSRLGYVNCVLLVADMQLDSPQSLRRRLDKLLFDEVVYRNSPSFGEFASLMDESALKEIAKRAARRGLRKSKRTRQGVVDGYAFEIGSGTDSRGFDGDLKEVYSLSELWLFQRAMRSHHGIVIRDYSNEPIELAKDLGFLSDGYALTEFGNLTKLFLVHRTGGYPKSQATPNPLVIFEEMPLRLLYLYALVKTDIIFAYILLNLGAGCGIHEVLKVSLEQLAGRLEENARLDEISEFKGLIELQGRIAKEPVEKAQRVPRIEYCVDLGFLERADLSRKRGSDKHKSAEAEDDGSYTRTTVLTRVSLALEKLIKQPNMAAQWLDQEFFKAAGLLYDHSLTPIKESEVRLLYFVRGAAFLQRRMGFIPGRIASLAGCVLAWLDGYSLEVSELFDEVYHVPKGKWSGDMKFSGGSRLDTEFMVAIDSDLLPKLETAVGVSRRL